MPARTSLALAIAVLAAVPPLAGGDAAPETLIDGGPGADATITQRTPAFAFSSSDPGATFACSVDDGPFAPCASPYELDSLSDGPHRFAVEAIGALGDADPTPAHRSFEVDASAPDATFIKTPGKRVVTTKRTVDVEFTFLSNKARSHFQCAREGGTFEPCSSPLDYRVGEGWHYIMVQAVDAAGNADPSPATDTFKVKRKKRKRR